jgi:transaldolase
MPQGLRAIDEHLREVALEALQNPNRETPPSDPALAKLASMGTQLWLDTGQLEEAAALWKAEFSALTTNNTLANQVVQTGVLDDVAADAVKRIKDAAPGISGDELAMELGFVINCHVALRLVRAFDAYVSVELHPSIAEDVDRSVEYARRYHSICPERFIIKIPLTPEGYCAVARVCPGGVPVNYTLGFSARQNYVAALMSGPTYVNVFLGRLNAVVGDNGMGDPKYIGEKATMATQMALRELRDAGRTRSRLIAASMRSASQVCDLAGVDVYTMPPKVARDFLAAGHAPDSLASQLGRDFPVKLANPEAEAAVEPLWAISDAVKALGDAVAGKGASMTGKDLRQADKDTGARLFHAFTDEEKAVIRADGKIPVMSKWLGSGIALDDLMTQSALQSFAVDQAALDARLLRIASL